VRARDPGDAPARREDGSFQALNFVASVSNVKIMESDPDAVPIRDELFTVLPEITDGRMTIPTGPGGGHGAQREGGARALVGGLSRHGPRPRRVSSRRCRWRDSSSGGGVVTHTDTGPSAP
jgi:hypothetical protein